MEKKTIDLIVAVRNEEENLPLFIDRVRAISLPENIELGAIFVEDSSTDRTCDILRVIFAEDERFRYVFLKQSYGQAAALALGLSYSTAAAAIMMDVDGGHPLDLVSVMAKEFAEGCDAVQAVRRSIASRNKYRDVGTWLFNRLFFCLTGIQTAKQNVYYRLISKGLYTSLLANNRWKHFLRIDYSAYKNLRVQYVEFDAKERISLSSIVKDYRI